MTVSEATVVTISYTLSIIHPNGDLEFVEKRTSHDPLDFVFGKGVVLPKIEEALRGKVLGQELQIKLRPEDAFGLRSEDLVMTYPIDKLPRNTPPQVGMKYQTQGPDGDVISVLVTKINEENQTLVLDGNHPLSDAFIQFDLKVLKVRKATSDEMTTGVVDDQKMH